MKKKTYNIGEEVDFGKETNQNLLDQGYAEEIKKVTKERKRTIKKK